MILFYFQIAVLILAAAAIMAVPVTIALIAIDRFAKATDGVPFDGDGGNEE